MAIFADGQNVDLSKYSQAIIHFAEQLGDVSILWAYHYWRKVKESAQQKLHTDGWQCLDIAGTIKNRIDDLLIKDYQQLCRSWQPDIIVLISGDKDFEYLVKAHLAQGRRVVVIGRRDHVSKRLKRWIPNDVYFVEDLAC
ncbi:MAG: NYN domain-containing protein [Cyanobacteria bacterium P01_H01_bin.21]